MSKQKQYTTFQVVVFLIGVLILGGVANGILDAMFSERYGSSRSVYIKLYPDIEAETYLTYSKQIFQGECGAANMSWIFFNKEMHVLECYVKYEASIWDVLTLESKPDLLIDGIKYKSAVWSYSRISDKMTTIGPHYVPEMTWYSIVKNLLFGIASLFVIAGIFDFFRKAHIKSKSQNH